MLKGPPEWHHHLNRKRNKSVTKMFIYVATSRVKNRRKKNLNLCRRRNALERIKKTNIYTHTLTNYNSNIDNNEK